LSIKTTPLYRADIQGLRAIAILLVVLAHAKTTFFSGGFIGVDIFFVLSGYLITSILVREFTKTGTIQISRFVARRLKRLLPALILMISLVSLFASLLLSSHEYLLQMSSSIFASTWTSNLYFAFTRIEYFTELQTKDLFLHTWSLGLEEQFYLVWPVLLLAVFSILKNKSESFFYKKLLIVISLLFITSLILSLNWSNFKPLWSFYLMPSRIWQFALGAWIFLWFGLRANQIADKVKNSYSVIFGISGLILIMASAVLMDSNMTYPSYWALFPSFGTALIIASGTQQNQNIITQLLSNHILVWIGNRSYSWYLWHWPVLILGYFSGADNQQTYILPLVLISLLFAILSYRWVELPFWKGKLSYFSVSKTILISIFVMLASLSALLNSLNYMQDKQEKNSIESISKARIDLPVIYKAGCDTWYRSSTVLPCLIGNKTSAKTVVLLGDSIGAQWFSLLPEIFKEPEWRIEVLTKSSCAMVDEDYFYGRIGKVYSVCTDWRNAVLDYLLKVKPQVVIVGSATTYNFTKEQWVQGSKRVFSRLSLVAEQIFVVPGTPSLSFNGPNCLEKWSLDALKNSTTSEAHTCHEDLTNSRSTVITSYLEQATKNLVNVSILNLNNLVCPEAHCSAKIADGTIVFRDQQHLTDTFVRRQVYKVQDKLVKSGLKLLITDHNNK
jgi:peptidoglycan/LPS O-acetylase OafA/YrhL